VFNLFGQTFVFGDNTLLNNDTRDASVNARPSISSVSGQSLTDGSATVAGSNGGLFTINDIGELTFDGSAGFENLYIGETTVTQITYTITDANGTQSTATVSVTVEGQALPLLATDDVLTTDQNTNTDSLNILDNDESPISSASVVAINGDSASVGQTIVGSEGGLFTLDASGNLAFDPNGDFDYLLEGDVQTTSVSYTIENAEGLSSTATMSVVVAGINDLPNAVDDAYVVDSSIDANTDVVLATGNILELFGSKLVLDDQTVIANDSDADVGSSLDRLKVSQLDSQALVNDTATAAGSTGGNFTITETGILTFNKGNDFDALLIGETQETVVSYTVIDPQGNEATASISVTVEGQARPIFAENDVITTDQNTSTDAFNVLSNDESLVSAASVVAINGDSASVGQTIVGSEGGLFTLDASGNLAFDPNGEFNYLLEGEAKSTSITYTIENAEGLSSTATASVVVAGINDLPNAVDDAYVVDSTVDANTDVVLASGTVHDIKLLNTYVVLDDQTVIANDNHVDGNIWRLEISQLGGEALVDGLATVAGSTGGNFTITDAGILTFNKGRDFDALRLDETQVTDVSYTVIDTNGGEATATISVTVQGQETPIIAENDSFIISEGDRLWTSQPDILGNDVGEGTLTMTNLDLRGSEFNIFRLDGWSEISTKAMWQLGNGNTYNTSFSYTMEDARGLTDSAVVDVTFDGIAGHNWTLQPYTSVQLNEGEIFTIDTNAFLGDTFTPYTNYSNTTNGWAMSDLINAGFDVQDLGGGLITIEGPDLAFGEGAGARATLNTVDLDGRLQPMYVDIVSLGTELEKLTGSEADLAVDDSFTVVNENRIGLVLGNILDNDASDLELVSLERVGASNEYNQVIYSSNVRTENDLNRSFEVGDFFVRAGSFSEDSLGPGEVLTQQYAYTVVDSLGNYDTATVTVNIEGQQDEIRLNYNDHPLVMINEDTTLTFDDSILVGNARDIDAARYVEWGGGLNAENLDGSALQGDLVENADGSYTYDPTVAFNALNSGEKAYERIEYTIVSDDGSALLTKLDIEIVGIDDPIVP
jgi:hypothetical protein